MSAPHSRLSISSPIWSSLIWLALAWPAAGCSADGGGSDGPDAGADEGPSYEDADWLMEPDRLLSIDIELAPADWDALRFQTRNILQLFGDTCGEQPSGSPFTYMPATVTVEGEVIEQVGVRKKGFLGSLDDVKPSLKIKFDEFVPGQHMSGLTRMTLNNSKQDPSYLNQCLGYPVFTRAGIPAPRCNFARVSVNGEPMGVYVHVESVKKPFLARHFADDDGNLYEGTLSDFRAGWDATFERKTNKSDPPGSEDRSDIAAVVDALALDDAAMVEALEGLIDLESFFRFWAVETLISHWDGYAGNNNNFFIYADPTTGRFTFMPWGADQLFGDAFGTNDPGLTRSALTRRLYLYEPTRERYLAHFEEILDQAWDDADALAEIDRMQVLIEDAIPADERIDFAAAVDQLRGAIDGREELFRDGLAAAGPGDADALADPLCFDQIGALTATFETAWDAGGSATATLAIEIDGQPVPLSGVAAGAGPDDNVAGRSVLFLVGQTTDNHTAIAFVSMPDEQAAPGALDVGAGRVEAALLLVPEGAQEADAIYFMSGPLTLDAAAPSPGAPWRGSAALTLWDVPFF